MKKISLKNSFQNKSSHKDHRKSSNSAWYHFTNNYKHISNCVSRNITTYIFDNLPQFLIIENLKKPSVKQNPPISFRNHNNWYKQNHWEVFEGLCFWMKRKEVPWYNRNSTMAKGFLLRFRTGFSQCLHNQYVSVWDLLVICYRE